MITTQRGAPARLLASLVLTAALAACGGGGGGTAPAPNADGNQPAPVAPVAPITPATPVTPALNGNTRITLASEASGSSCPGPAGGVKVTAFVDENGNNTLDGAEVSKVSFVCYSPPGAAGTPSTTGLTALINLTSEPAGSACALGGRRIAQGLDANSNGTLDASEVSSSAPLCSTATVTAGGSDANLSLVDEARGANCSSAGKKITTATGGTASDSYLCYPAPGLAFTWKRITAAAANLAANFGHIIASVTPGPVTLTLPVEPGIKVNDTITVRGESSNAWTIAQNAGQTIGTRSLPGAVQPGLVFAPAANTTHNWWSAASSASGQKLAAVGNNFTSLHPTGATASGRVWTSADGGVTWTELVTPGTQPPSSAWVSIASSADGTKLAVVGIGSGIWTSADSGATWTSNDLPQYFPGTSIYNTEFVSISMSADGSRMVAATLYTTSVGTDGRIYTYEQTPSLGFGQGTWTQQASPTSIHMWRGVAMSADGSTLVAAAYQDSQATNEGVYVSNDHGATWTNKLSPAGTTAYRVAISADGKGMIMAERFGKIYTSSDAGLSWSPGASSGGFNAVASSADGKTLMAVQANGFVAAEGPNPPPDRNGKLLVSSDGGVTWANRGPAGEWWRGAAMSADGNRLVAARDVGSIYVSTSNRTTYGTAGSITGAQTNDITLRYLGDGLFDATSANGPAFTIK